MEPALLHLPDHFGHLLFELLLLLGYLLQHFRRHAASSASDKTSLVHLLSQVDDLLFQLLVPFLQLLIFSSQSLSRAFIFLLLLSADLSANDAAKPSPLLFKFFNLLFQGSNLSAVFFDLKLALLDDVVELKLIVVWNARHLTQDSIFSTKTLNSLGHLVGFFDKLLHLFSIVLNLVAIMKLVSQDGVILVLGCDFVKLHAKVIQISVPKIKGGTVLLILAFKHFYLVFEHGVLLSHEFSLISVIFVD